VWDAKSREAVKDRSTDLGLRDLPIEVTSSKALPQ
jgi:hypothetical protein